MRRLSDRFAEAAAACPDLAALATLLEHAARDLGYDYFALLEHSSLDPQYVPPAGPAGAGSLLRIDNYPPSWVAEILARGFAADDPVHLASRRASRGFAWSELDAWCALNHRHLQILERSRCHGVGPGFTVPAHVPGEPGASCSFAVADGAALPELGLATAELVGAHALAAARRLRPASPARPRPYLSRRERQCVRLVAMGKSDWEIAQILGLSTETARQYVKRARAAYDLLTRTQLAVHALRDSWVTFDEAIPPNG